MLLHPYLLLQEECNSPDGCPDTAKQSETETARAHKSKTGTQGHTSPRGDTPPPSTASTQATPIAPPSPDAAPLCSPKSKVEPNGTYSGLEMQNIYDDNYGSYTHEQTETANWCNGKISFGLVNNTHRNKMKEGVWERGDVGGQLFLVENLISAHVCFEELDYQPDCSIEVGIVELVSREEVLLFFKSRPAGGLFVRNVGLQNADYMINTVSPHASSPFVNEVVARATFYTPSPTTSSMMLLSKTPEYIDHTCSLKISDHDTATLLNRTEYLLEKVFLIVPINNNHDVKIAPIAIRFLYFAVATTDCSEGSPHLEELYGKYAIQFISGDETREYTDALQAMGSNGWDDNWREPILPPQLTQWVMGRCTIDPFEVSSGVPRCDTSMFAGKSPRDEL